MLWLFDKLHRETSLISLPAATKLGQGNIFRSVCQEFCPRGGGCLPQCMLGYTSPGSKHPPPEADTPSCPRSRHPWEQTPPGADTPWEQTPPGSRYPRSRHPPGADTPTESGLQHTVNKRPVSILLECILVQIKFYPK